MVYPQQVRSRCSIRKGKKWATFSNAENTADRPETRHPKVDLAVRGKQSAPLKTALKCVHTARHSPQALSQHLNKKLDEHRGGKS